MELIDILLIVAGAVAVLSKIVDCVSTIRCYRKAGNPGPNSLEQNPIGRLLFRRFGVTGGCWLVFAIVMVIVAAACAEVMVYDIFALKCAAIAILAVATWAHVSAGIYNMTGHATIIVKVMRALYLKMGK